jgi:hypothetical protein
MASDEPQNSGRCAIDRKQADHFEVILPLAESRTPRQPSEFAVRKTKRGSQLEESG